MPYGSFWYRGVDIAIVGFALVFAATCSERKISYLPLLAMMAAGFFLTSNKGGIEKAFLWGAFALYVFNVRLSERSQAPSRIALAITVIYFGLGSN